MSQTSINFTQINLHKCKEACDLLIRRLTVKRPQIALIQEPYAHKNKLTHLISDQFSIFRGVQDANPRACIITPSEMNASLIPQLSDKDQVAVLLKLGPNSPLQTLIIASVYLPYDSNDPPPGELFGKLVSYCGRMNTPLLIGSDANSQCTVWGSTKTNKRGSSLLEYLVNTDLKILNIGNEPTFINISRREVIDVTLCSPSLRLLVKGWRVSNEESLSDHRYLTFTLSGHITAKPTFRDCRRTDWGMFSDILTHSPAFSDNLDTRESLDIEVNTLTKTLTQAFEESCPPRTSKPRPTTPWWNQELSRLRRTARCLLRQALWLKTAESWDNYRTAQREYKMSTRAAKIKGWEKFCNEIEGISASAKMHKILAKDPSLKPGLILKEDGEYTKDEQGTLQRLMEVHFPGSIAQEHSPDGAHGLGPVHNPPSDVETDEIVNIDMVRWAINSFEPFKSAGPDDIIPVLLQKAPDNILNGICHIFRASLKLAHTPKLWKLSKVVFIPKPGRNDYHSAKAFRPICLTSVLLKTLERLVDRYIRDKCLKIIDLSPDQHAFRKTRSTDSALHALISDIEKALLDKEDSLSVFLDIEGAFDNTTVAAICTAARAKGVSSVAIAWIRDSLTGRKLTAALNGASRTVITSRGCPQGSVLAPLLWLLVVDMLLSRLRSSGIKCHGYADDIVITVQGKFRGIICDIMQRALISVEAWCIDNQLSVNPTKTNMLLHTRSRDKTLPRGIRLFGEHLCLTSEAKHLGVIIDEKLNWAANLEHRINKATNTFWLLRRAIGDTWGLCPKVVKWFYDAIIVPAFSHGCLVWNHRVNAFTRQKLSSLQRLATVAITGAMRTTPSRALEALLYLPPLEKRLETLALKAALRLNLAGLWKTNTAYRAKGHASVFNMAPVGKGPKPCDWMPPEPNFVRNFLTQIHSREEWQSSDHRPIALDARFWFTDGSKDDNSSGAGIFRAEPRVELSFPLGSEASVFQTEVLAILRCAEEAAIETSPSVTICSDSQAALKALNSRIVHSRVVWECIEMLNSLAETRFVQLIWVPGHSNIEGNEKADELARLGSNSPFVGPLPIVPVPLSGLYSEIQAKETEAVEYSWASAPGCETTKKLLPKPKLAITDQLIRLKKTDLSLLVSLLTGHNKLNAHLHKIGVKSEPDCDKCGHTNETSIHFLCECPKYWRLRAKIFGNAFCNTATIASACAKDVLRFAKDSGRFWRGDV